MRKLSVLAVPSAIALALVSFPGVAQDVSKSPTARKAATSTTAKAAKPTQAADRSIGTSTKAVVERTGATQGAAKADQQVPGKSSADCQGKDIDA